MEKIKKILQSKLFYSILCLLSAVYVAFSLAHERKSIYDESDVYFVGTLEKITVQEKRISFTLKSQENLICNYYIDDEESPAEYRKNYPLGVKLGIRGSLNIPLNNTVPNTFNYKEYLYYHNTFYTCNVDSIDIIDDNLSFFYKFKNFIINRIMSFDTKDYLYTMIIGDKSLMDDSVLDKYKQNGVTHLFAISGMHIGLFSAAILNVLKKLHTKEGKRYFFTVLFIWLYAFLTGFTSSVLRASVLFTFISINKILNLKIKTIYLLILSGIVLVIFNPFIIKDIGFIYSFITTFGLIYNSELLSKHKVIGTSIVAMLYSLPVSINNFYSFNLLSIFFNVIFVPYVSTIIYPLCLLTFIFRFLEPVLKIGIILLEILNDFSSSLDWLIFIVPKMHLILVILYYALLVLGLKKKFYKITIILFAVILINKMKPLLDSKYHVEFLDVGQGDSILIRSPHNNEIFLIDTGGKLSYDNNTYHVTKNTMTYLYSLGIEKIDILILTHGDYDHMGEAINLVENFKVEKVIFNCGEFNELEQELIKVLDKKKIPYYSCISELNVDKNKLYFLQTKDYDNENDNSNVIYTELNGYRFLFMGDASTTTEKEILTRYNLSNIDVLKVGHHGSKTSSSKDFINEINHKYSIISVGKNNRYGHPNKEVLNVLEDSKIYRTDIDGSIMFKIKNNKLKIETCTP